MTTLALNFKQAALTLLVLGLVLLSSVATNASSDPDVPPLKWSPDGSYIARVVGTTIEVRDATSTQVLHELKGHTDFIPMVAWSPDSTRLASPSFDQTVRVWRISDGALLHTLTGHNDAITAVAWTPNGDRLISFGYDSEPSVFHWDANTGALLSKQPGGLMIDAQFGPKGQPLALTNTTFIIVVDIVDDFTFEFIGESPYTRCCVNQMYYIEWNPDGTMFATGSVNGLVTLWDASNAQILHQFVANPHHAPDHRDVDDVTLSWVRAVTFSGDGQTVLAVSGDGTVRAWDTASGTLLEEAHVPPLMNAAWSPDGTRLAYEDRQGAMQFVTSPINVTPTPTATPTVTETPTTTPTSTNSPPPPACDITIAAADVAGLISAITAANGNGTPDTICLTNSTYTLTAVDNTTDGANGLPSITGDLTIAGNGATLARADQTPEFRLLRVAPGAALTLSDLTLTNGRAGGDNAGAILNLGTLHLDTVTLAGHRGRYGGALYNQAALSVTGTRFTANVAQEQGAGAPGS